MATKEEIYNFLNSQSLMVVSSLNHDGNPQSAVVGFGQTNDLQLVFGTSELRRKHKNIIANGHVSVVAGWSDKTVQYEGVARVLSGQEEMDYSEQYFKKNE